MHLTSRVRSRPISNYPRAPRKDHAAGEQQLSAFSYLMEIAFVFVLKDTYFLYEYRTIHERLENGIFLTRLKVKEIKYILRAQACSVTCEHSDAVHVNPQIIN